MASRSPCYSDLMPFSASRSWAFVNHELVLARKKRTHQFVPRYSPTCMRCGSHHGMEADRHCPPCLGYP